MTPRIPKRVCVICFKRMTQRKRAKKVQPTAAGPLTQNQVSPPTPQAADKNAKARKTTAKPGRTMKTTVKTGKKLSKAPIKERLKRKRKLSVAATQPSFAGELSGSFEELSNKVAAEDSLFPLEFRKITEESFLSERLSEVEDGNGMRRLSKALKVQTTDTVVVHASCPPASAQTLALEDFHSSPNLIILDLKKDGVSETPPKPAEGPRKKSLIIELSEESLFEPPHHEEVRLRTPTRFLGQMTPSDLDKRIARLQELQQANRELERQLSNAKDSAAYQLEPSSCKSF